MLGDWHLNLSPTAWSRSKVGVIMVYNRPSWVRTKSGIGLVWRVNGVDHMLFSSTFTLFFGPMLDEKG
jgi:hypothetical protein